MVKGPGGKGASGTEGGGGGEGEGHGRDGGRDRSRELTSPSANFITELVVFAQIISIYSTQAGNLFASECMREWNLPRSQHRPPMCGSPSLSSRYTLCSSSMKLVLLVVGACLHACMHTYLPARKCRTR